jgi:putative nucleotidyltransferase with HDIG domain
VDRGRLNLSMKNVTKRYIALVFVAAVVAVAAMYFLHPAYSRSQIEALGFLSAIAILSEMLAFTLAREGRGSVAFIPYLASVVLVPSWPAVVVVALVKGVMELFARVDPKKAVFNASSHAVILSAAIAVYWAFGGRSLLDVEASTLNHTVGQFGLAAIIAFITSFIANNLLVSIAITLESDSPMWRHLKHMIVPKLGGDLMSAPLVFVFAWVYAAFGWMPAFISWIPFLSLRHLGRLNVELQRTNEELLQLMVKSIEARDPYTSGHSRRVSKYAVSIARLLHLSEKEIGDIETAALLHDVGKIYEKYGPILLSPDRLSAAQWVVMQEHPVDGANLVSTITRMRHLVPFVRHHHENWDGTGYPDRIAGDAIPLASRIIMFADTIDAMTTERPYRRPLGEVDVCAELAKCRGKQFDPAITDLLLTAGVWKTLFGEARSRGLKKLELVGSKSA